MEQLIEDFAHLNKIKVPLPELRVIIIDLMKKGEKEIALGDFLFLIRKMLRDKNE